jgi:hypothetical protein
MTDRYRVGNHQPQNVYRGDAYIGVMFTADDAALIVEALNDRKPTELPDEPVTEHRPEYPGGDGLGYGRCTGCGELWPCTASRGTPR